jgi:flagellin-like protein
MTKLINKIFPKRSNNKRAVSPVIATILLIALTVSAAAIVYFVVIPLFQGNGVLVQTTDIELSDTDTDGKFDSMITTIKNIGTDTVTLPTTVTVKVYNPTTATYSWAITSERQYITQEEKDITIECNDNQSQLAAYSSFEIVISYGKNSMKTGRQVTPYTSGSQGPGGEDPLVENYTSMVFYERTSADDPSTSRGTFPTSSGYSPALWFLVGIFKSGVSNLEADDTDYINTNGYGAAEDYRPYLGIPDEFDQDISLHTGQQVLAHNDTGNYPGCVTFRGTSFDGADTLNWPQRGIIYMYTYIYNPTEEAMDVSLSIQSDDAYTLWVNGDQKGSGDHTSNGWKSWRTPVTTTLNPGYNIVTVRTVDIGGNWDAQILFWDTGATDSLTNLLNVWPFAEPTSTYW